MFEVLKGCKFCQRAFLNYSQNTNLTNLCIVSSEDAIEYWSLTLYLHLIRIHNNGIFLYSVSGLSQIWWKFIRCNFFKSTLVCRIFRYFSRLRKAYKWFEKGAENENIVVFLYIGSTHAWGRCLLNQWYILPCLFYISPFLFTSTAWSTKQIVRKAQVKMFHKMAFHTTFSIFLMSQSIQMKHCAIWQL